MSRNPSQEEHTFGQGSARKLHLSSTALQTSQKAFVQHAMISDNSDCSFHFTGHLHSRLENSEESSLYQPSTPLFQRSVSRCGSPCIGDGLENPFSLSQSVNSKSGSGCTDSGGELTSSRTTFIPMVRTPPLRSPDVELLSSPSLHDDFELLSPSGCLNSAKNIDLKRNGENSREIHPQGFTKDEIDPKGSDEHLITPLEDVNVQYESTAPKIDNHTSYQFSTSFVMLLDTDEEQTDLEAMTYYPAEKPRRNNNYDRTRKRTIQYSDTEEESDEEIVRRKPSWRARRF